MAPQAAKWNFDKLGHETLRANKRDEGFACYKIDGAPRWLCIGNQVNMVLFYNLYYAKVFFLNLFMCAWDSPDVLLYRVKEHCFVLVIIMLNVIFALNSSYHNLVQNSLDIHVCLLIIENIADVPRYFAQDDSLIAC